MKGCLSIFNHPMSGGIIKEITLKKFVAVNHSIVVWVWRCWCVSPSLGASVHALDPKILKFEIDRRFVSITFFTGSCTCESMSMCCIDYMNYANNSLSLECKIHFLGVKHTVSHLHNSLILMFYYILLWSVRNSYLVRDALSYEKWVERIANIFTSTINPKTIDILDALIFHKS